MARAILWTMRTGTPWPLDIKGLEATQSRLGLQMSPISNPWPRLIGLMYKAVEGRARACSSSQEVPGQIGLVWRKTGSVLRQTSRAWREGWMQSCGDGNRGDGAQAPVAPIWQITNGLA